MKINTYLNSGVNIDAGNKLVEDIKPIAKSTIRSGVIGGLGSFGALFNLSNIGKKYNQPVLVSSTDGVGTKLCIAQEVVNHENIGIDLVAMCVNDLLAQGAEPLFFLDYFATGCLDNNIALTVIKGIAQGCKDAQMALIGGETAEMPGLYDGVKYDLAGFAVGIVEMSEILPRISKIKEGDLLIGVSSSGLHSNGFSLVRKIISNLNINYFDKSPWNNETWAEVLLRPTRIYVKNILSVTHLIKGIAHITGGGLIENIPRVLPNNLIAQIQLGSWKRPEIFTWLQSEGNVSEDELLRTFNCGIGMVLVIEESCAELLKNILISKGEVVYNIGKIIDRKYDDDKVIFI